MTAPSPVQLAATIVSYTVTANGAALPTTFQIVAIDVWTGVNKLPKARIVISDGSAAEENFPISDAPTLAPGAQIAISLGYQGQETQVFSGVIYRHGLQATINGPSRLVVEATDKAMVMALARENAVFQNVTDSQVCQQLITAAGLTAEVAATTTVHETIVQYYATAWDLMVLRAQASGMVVTVADGVVAVAPPSTSTAPVLTLTYGQSLLDFRGDMDASTQFTPSAIQSFAWNPADQTLAQSTQAQADVSTPGNISSDALAQVFNVQAYLQQTAGAMEVAELTQWSSAELLKTQLAKIRGEARFQGSALARTGCMVTLAGLGDRFNGDAYVSGVHHRYAEGLWRTMVEIGLSPNWFAQSAPAVAAPGASGQLPPANNLQTGTVLAIANDPDGEFRVLVNLPLLQAPASTGVWARFGSYYASQAVGSCFYPEIGDEVVVAFLSGDPRYPVILGSLYSKKNAPPQTPEAANNTKTLVSRSKMRIDFIENQNTVQILTPKNQSVVLNDQGQSVTLSDMNGNSVTLNESGIAIKSASDISITASGSITLTAQSSLSATGTSSAKLTSTGIVQVKGASVALNP
jgi:Rhs element Vgr protein